jgi:hypothetical protein
MRADLELEDKMAHVKNILILGGYGRTGMEITRLLLRYSRHNICLAGRDLTKASQTAQRLNWKHSGERVTGVQVNVALKKQLTGVLVDHDLVIDSIPETAFGGQIAQAALDAGIDYIDLNANKEKHLRLKGLDVEIQTAGHTFITGAGFVHGVPYLIERYLAGYFDSVDTVTMGCLLKEKTLSHRACVDLVPTLRDSPMIFSDGSGAKRSFNRVLRILRASWFGRLLRDSDYIPEHQQILGVKTTATGTMNGRREDLKFTLEHKDPYRATAIATVPCVLGLLDGSIKQPGVHMMGHLLDPERYMDNLWDMGMTISLQGLPDTWDEKSRSGECRPEETLKYDIGLIGQVA